MIVLGAALLPFAVINSPVSVGLADVLAPLVAFYLFAVARGDGWLKLYVTLVLASVAAICVTALLMNEPATGPLFALGYYAKPWLYFFAAKHLVLRATDPSTAMIMLMRLVTAALAIVVVMIALGFLYAGRLTTTALHELDGASLLGFVPGTWQFPVKLYGNGQVNTTAGILFLATPVFLFQWSRSAGAARFLWAILLAMSWGMILFSGSRGAVLCLAIYLFVFIAFGASSTSVGSLSRKVLAAALVTAAVLGSSRLISASPKYQRTIEALEGQSALDITAGRGDLVRVMLSDIYRSPLLGTSFGDFERFHRTLATVWLDSSPHNSYLGAMHKGGLLIGLGFVMLMFHALTFRTRGLSPDRQMFGPPLAFALAIGLMPVLDVFTTALLASLTLVILGAVSGEKVHQGSDSSVAQPQGEPRPDDVGSGALTMPRSGH